MSIDLKCPCIKSVAAIWLVMSLLISVPNADAFQGKSDFEQFVIISTIEAELQPYQPIHSQKIVDIEFGLDTLALAPSNAITISKRVTSSLVNVGSPVTFVIEVGNNEERTLTGVTVTDPLVPDCDSPIGTMAPSTVQSYNCTHINAQTDFVNVATVVTNEGSRDSDSAFVDVDTPEVKITKTAESMVSGGTVDFTIQVQNIGNESLENISVSDPLTPDCSQSVSNINVGVSQSFDCSGSAVSDGFINTATVSATGSESNTGVNDTDRVNVFLESGIQMCPANVLAHWPLDDASYDDLVGGHDGECTNCPVVESQEKIDGSLVFDGFSHTVEVPLPAGDDTFSFGADDSFSVATWVKTAAGNDCLARQITVGRKLNSTERWWLGCKSGLAQFHLQTSGPSDNREVTAAHVSDGQWHHLVGVRDASGTAGGGKIRLYVDGLPVGESSTAYTNDFAFNEKPITIGSLDNDEHFKGFIDETTIFNRVLTINEIQQYYLEGHHANHSICDSGDYSPVIYSTPVGNASVQNTYGYNVVAVGQPQPTFGLTQAPGGMSINPTTGEISWVPQVQQAGLQNIIVNANNSAGLGNQAFDITVEGGAICYPGIISYWPLDEVGPGNYTDNRGDHTATCTNCPTPDANGNVMGTQVFSPSQVSVPANQIAEYNWVNSDSFSIEFWMKSTNTCDGTNQVLVGRNDLPSTSDFLHWWVGIDCQTAGKIGRVTFALNDSDGVGSGETSSAIIDTQDRRIDDGQWHYIAAIRDGTNGVNRLYVDGSLAVSEARTYSGDFSSSTATLDFAWLSGFTSSNFSFDGALDEVAIYKAALPPEAIVDHYQRGTRANDSGINVGFCYDARLDVEANPQMQSILPPANVEFTVVATNIGDVDLTDVVLSSPFSTCLPNDLVNLTHSGGSTTYTCTNTDVQATLNSVVTATGNLPTYFGDQVMGIDTAVVTALYPGIELSKHAFSPIVEPLMPITYTFSVLNTGNSDLNNIRVTDNQCTIIGPIEGDNYLAPNEAIEYYCVRVGAVFDIDNTASVTATVAGPNLNIANYGIGDTDSVSVRIVEPAIEVASLPDIRYIRAGDVTTFTVSLTNTGGITLTGVTAVTESMPDCDLTPTTMSPNQRIETTCTIATTTDITNTVFVTGTSLFGTVVTDTDSSLADVIHPAVAIAQFPLSLQTGIDAEIEIRVSNLGDAPLTVTSIAALGCDTTPAGPVDDSGNDGVVGVEEVWTYTCMVNNVPEGFINNLEVEATVPGGFVVTDFQVVTSQPITFNTYLPQMGFNCENQQFWWLCN